MKKAIERLRALKTKAIDGMQAILTLAQTENRQNTSVENAEYARLKAEAEGLGAEIAELEAQLAAPASTTPANNGNVLVMPAAAVDNTAAVAQGVAAENKRQSSIRTRFAAAKRIAPQIPDAMLDQVLAPGVTEDQAANLLFDQINTLFSAMPQQISHHTAGITNDVRDKNFTLMTDALLHRHNPGKHKLADGNPYTGMNLLRMAEESLQDSGVKTRGMNPLQIATRAMQFNSRATVIGVPSREEFAGAGMSTSDFPFILAAVANKFLRDAYAAEPQTWRPFCRQSNITDFKAKYVNQLGDAPSLELVNESGEFKYGSIPEARETYSLKTYGKILPLTRQAIINDDMRAFTRIPELQGRSVARLENNLIWKQLTDNPTMGDGITLFHASHNNVGSAAAISVDAIGAMRALLRKQTGLTPDDLAETAVALNLVPKFLLAPAGKEQLALQFTRNGYALYPETPGQVNVWASLLEPIVEPRLDAASATAWYIVADPGQIDTIEFAYLEGQEGAYYETRMGFDVDGMELKVRHDFGSKVIDFRAFTKNAGA